MNHSQFAIGQEFWCSERRWRCTDIGSRVVVAIRVDEATQVTISSATRAQRTITISGEEAERQGWFNGPPYGVAECVFDENDFEACSLTEEEP